VTETLRGILEEAAEQLDDVDAVTFGEGVEWRGGGGGGGRGAGGGGGG
jgi:hypothetical protein